jgi:hypothetical protein
VKELKQIEAHAQAIKTKHRQELEDAAQLVAAPGFQVVVIRRPWPVGRRGTVMAVLGASSDAKAVIDFDGKSQTIPLSAIARREEVIDCARAQIRHKVAWIKFQGGEFLE